MPADGGFVVDNKNSYRGQVHLNSSSAQGLGWRKKRRSLQLHRWLPRLAAVEDGDTLRHRETDSCAGARFD